MPLFGWMKWPRGEAERVEAEHEEGNAKQAEAAPCRMLMRELLWRVEERERSAHQVELRHQLAHGTLGYHWLQSYGSLIPPSERQQLEHLCAQIQPAHAAAVLSRFRDVLASYNILPWELVDVFKQVLRDFLGTDGDDDEDRSQSQPMEAWTNHYQTKQGFITPTVPDCSVRQREEIPTISSYVDRSLRGAASYAAHRDWDLPYYYPLPCRCPKAYSTTL